MEGRQRYHPPPLVVGDRVRVISKGVYGVIESVDGEFLVVQASDGNEYRRKALGLRHCPTKEQIANKKRQLLKSRYDAELRQALGLPRFKRSALLYPPLPAHSGEQEALKGE